MGCWTLYLNNYKKYTSENDIPWCLRPILYRLKLYSDAREVDTVVIRNNSLFFSLDIIILYWKLLNIERYRIFDNGHHNNDAY